MSRRTERILLVIIFLISLGFRLTGIRWGLPYPYGHDGFYIVTHAVRFFDGDFNPQWFAYPSFHMYFLYFVYLLIYWIGNISGCFSSICQFRSLFDIDPSLFIIVGRVVAALFGSGSVLLCYILAKKLFDQRVASLALLSAILPMEVLNAHYCTSDVPVIFWFLLAFIFCARIMEKPNLRYYILSGIFAGIAGGTKYPGLGLIFPIIVAHLMRLYRSEKKWRSILFSKEHYKLVIALGVVGLAFFISTPYVFLDYKHSIPHLAFIFNVYGNRLYDIYQGQNESQMFMYLKDFFLNFGFLFTLLGILGIGMKIKKITREEVLLLSWIIPYAVIIHKATLKTHHYFLLLTPLLLIFFANAVIGVKERFEWKLSYGQFVIISAAILIPVQPLYYSIKNDIILIRRDIREEAHDWIIKNIPERTILAKELLGTPFLPKNRYNIVYEGWSLGDHDMSWYKERKVEYFLVGKKAKDLLSYPGRPTSQHRQFYKDLEKEACLIYKVDLKDKGLFMDFHNPPVLIYKIKLRGGFISGKFEL